MGWESGVLGFDSRRMLRIFLFTTASRPVLGPTQPPIQWVLGALSLGVKRPRPEADHSPPPSVEVKECMELHLYSPSISSWRGVQFKKIAQGQLYLYLLFIRLWIKLTSSYWDCSTNKSAKHPNYVRYCLIYLIAISGNHIPVRLLDNTYK
jgi:hypothetical protein